YKASSSPTNITLKVENDMLSLTADHYFNPNPKNVVIEFFELPENYDTINEGLEPEDPDYWDLEKYYYSLFPQKDSTSRTFTKLENELKSLYKDDVNKALISSSYQEDLNTLLNLNLIKKSDDDIYLWGI